MDPDLDPASKRARTDPAAASSSSSSLEAAEVVTFHLLQSTTQAAILNEIASRAAAPKDDSPLSFPGEFFHQVGVDPYSQ